MNTEELTKKCNYNLCSTFDEVFNEIQKIINEDEKNNF